LRVGACRASLRDALRAREAEDEPMDRTRRLERAVDAIPQARAARCHRFMESADINAAFRLMFGTLRDNVRRGMRFDGETYGIQMHPTLPGHLLNAVWVSPAGAGGSVRLDDTRRRRALYDRLLDEAHPYTLYAYLCERPSASANPAVLYLEVVGEDAAYAAEFALRPGQAWHRRELLRARHRRLDLRALT
jgi:hypothetical protein